MADISPLRRRMIEDMTVRNLSPATQQSYISARSTAEAVQRRRELSALVRLMKRLARDA